MCWVHRQTKQLANVQGLKTAIVIYLSAESSSTDQFKGNRAHQTNLSAAIEPLYIFILIKDPTELSGDRMSAI